MGPDDGSSFRSAAAIGRRAGLGVALPAIRQDGLRIQEEQVAVLLRGQNAGQANDRSGSRGPVRIDPPCRRRRHRRGILGAEFALEHAAGEDWAVPIVDLQSAIMPTIMSVASSGLDNSPLPPQHPIQSRQGSRIAREHIRLASSSPTNCSFTGSHFNGRPSR